MTVELTTSRGLQIRDTADCKSALLGTGRGFRSFNFDEIGY
jgi:hypothetical protein